MPAGTDGGSAPVASPGLPPLALPLALVLVAGWPDGFCSPTGHELVSSLRLFAPGDRSFETGCQKLVAEVGAVFFLSAFIRKKVVLQFVDALQLTKQQVPFHRFRKRFPLVDQHVFPTSLEVFEIVAL